MLNYGASANWAFARIGAMTGSNAESSLEAFGRAMRDRRWVENVASETEVAGILDRLANGLNEGGIGIGILNAYAPGAGVQELTAVCQLAAAHDVPTFTHVAYMSRIDPESAAEAYIRLIGYAGATGAHMHICHFNSSSKTDIERCAVLVAKAQAQGLPITVEAYPYGTGSTVLAAAFFSDPEFEARNGTGYDSVQRVTDGRRFRDREELLAAQAEEPSTLVLWHILDIENNAHHRDLLDMSVLYPGGAIASDAMPWTLSDGSVYTGDAWPLPEDATSHPRSAGCFTRFIREWVRERQAVSLLEGVRKCALIPAEILAASTPAMRAKGRLQPGADADMVVFDFDTLTDRATFSAMNRPSEGVRHLLVSGQPLITDGVLDVAARPGRPVRRPVAGGLSMPVPILLVAGFLGAGKTTVVNHLLAHAEGRRIAAVVNDFGAINIDAELIAGAGDGVVSLSNGCICCSLEGDLLRTLAALLRRDPRPEGIVIETSGVADPADIVRNLMDPVIWREAPLETVLCVVDATTPAAMLDDPLLRSQLRAADVVALSKVDLADAADQRAGARCRPGGASGGGGGRCAAWRGARGAAVSRGPGSCAGAARAGAAAAGGRSVRDAELDVGTAGVAAPAAAGDRPAGAEAGAGEGAVRDGGAARAADGVSVRRRAGDAGAGRDAGGRNAAGTDRVHCRDRRSVARRDRQDHGRMHRSRGYVKQRVFAANTWFPIRF